MTHEAHAARWWRLGRSSLVAALLLAPHAGRAESPLADFQSRAGEGWSADLLHDLLKYEPQASEKVEVDWLIGTVACAAPFDGTARARAIRMEGLAVLEGLAERGDLSNEHQRKVTDRARRCRSEVSAYSRGAGAGVTFSEERKGSGPTHGSRRNPGPDAPQEVAGLQADPASTTAPEEAGDDPLEVPLDPTAETGGDPADDDDDDPHRGVIPDVCRNCERLAETSATSIVPNPERMTSKSLLQSPERISELPRVDGLVDGRRGAAELLAPGAPGAATSAGPIQEQTLQRSETPLSAIQATKGTESKIREKGVRANRAVGR